MALELRQLLRSLRVWDVELPGFDPGTAPDAAPDAPVTLFREWFAQAVAAGQPEPHALSLATTDDDGRPDVRTVLLHDADEHGWVFASHAGSRKGRQLAARPYAALGFYWPVQGRQIRVRGRVTVAPPAVAQADLRARSTGALASALVGRQSEVLTAQEKLARASRAAWERAEREPDAPAPTWTVYVVEPYEVEFFQGDAHREHVRLRYRRADTEDTEAGAGGEQGRDAAWVKELLWP